MVLRDELLRSVTESPTNRSLNSVIISEYVVVNSGEIGDPPPSI